MADTEEITPDIPEVDDDTVSEVQETTTEQASTDDSQDKLREHLRKRYLGLI